MDGFMCNVDIDGSSLLHLATNSGVLAVRNSYTLFTAGMAKSQTLGNT